MVASDSHQKDTDPSDHLEESSSVEEPDTASILHIGSVFLSSANVTSARRVEFRRAFNHAINFAIERAVDAVVQTGKLFATRSPAGTDVANLREQLRRLDDAGITFINAGSERDGDMDLVSELESDGLLERPDTEPITIKGTAIYRIPPIDGQSEFGQLASYAPPDPDSRQTLVAAPRTTTPPLENGDFERDEFVEAAPFEIDGLLLGNSRNKQLQTHTEGDGPSVFAAGPTELTLRKRLLGKQAEYPCQIAVLHPSGEYEPITIPHNDLEVFHVDCPSDAALSDLKNAVDGPNADSILIGLRGHYSPNSSFSANDVESWLESLTDVYKVWDERETGSQSGASEGTLTVTTQYSSLETDSMKDGQVDTIPDALSADHSASDSQTDSPSTPHKTTADETVSDDKPEPTAPSLSTETTEFDLADREDIVDSSDIDVELQQGIGTKVDPEEHLAGRSLEQVGYASVEATDDNTCGYRLDCRRFDKETDQRVTVIPDDGIWKCPHESYADGRCAFHHHDVEAKVVEHALTECLTGDGDRELEFIGATFPEVDLSNETLGKVAGAPIDFRYAQFSNDCALIGSTVDAPLRIDGAQFDGELDISNADIRKGISARETWFRDSIDADSTIHQNLAVIHGCLIEGCLEVSSATFYNKLILSQSTIAEELVTRRSEFGGQFAAYSLHVNSTFDGNQSVFKYDIRLKGARFEDDVKFVKSRFESFIDLEGAEFRAGAELNGESIRVGNSIYIHDADFGEINLEKAQISGAVEYGDTRVAGDFIAKEAVFEGGLQQYDDKVALEQATRLKIGGDLSLFKTRLLRDTDLDVEVAGELDARDMSISALLDVAGEAESFDASRSTFEGSLEYSADTEQLVDLTDVDISETCRIYECELGTDLNLVRATIQGQLSMSDLSISGEIADLSQIQLGDSIRIDNSDIPLLQLKDTRLEGAFYINVTTFENVDLSNSTVSGRLKWTKISISEQLLMNDASFHDTITIDTSGQDGSQPDSHFDPELDMEGGLDDRITIGEIEAQDANFTNRVEITTVSQKIFINDIYANGRIEFTGSLVANLEADDVTIEEELRLKQVVIQDISVCHSDVYTLDCVSLAANSCVIEDSRIDTIILDGVNKLAENTSSDKLIVNAQRAELIDGNISITDSLYLDLTDSTIGSLRFSETTGGPHGAAFLDHIRFYRTIFNGFRIGELPGLGSQFELHRFDVTQEEYQYEDPTPAGLTTTYRRAKNGAAEVGDRAAEGKFFEQEKTYLGDQYKQDSNLIDYGKNRLWSVAAGYGESPFDVMKFSAGSVLLFAGLYPIVRAVELLFTGEAPNTIITKVLAGTLLPGNYSGFSGWLLLSAESFTTLILGATPFESTSLRILAAFEGFVGALLIALFLFTLTKSVDR